MKGALRTAMIPRLRQEHDHGDQSVCEEVWFDLTQDCCGVTGMGYLFQPACSADDSFRDFWDEE